MEGSDIIMYIKNSSRKNNSGKNMIYTNINVPNHKRKRMRKSSSIADLSESKATQTGSRVLILIILFALTIIFAIPMFLYIVSSFARAWTFIVIVLAIISIDIKKP